MDKHGKHEIAEPLNEALEKHYKTQIELRDGQLDEAKALLAAAKSTIEKLEFEIEMHKAHVEELERALIKMTIEAAMKGATI